MWQRYGHFLKRPNNLQFFSIWRLPNIGLDVTVEVGLLGMKLCNTYK